MKKTLVSLIVASSLLAAFMSPAEAWYCKARSPTGSMGWATSYSLRRAQYNALYECAIHTPRGYVCVITSCR